MKNPVTLHHHDLPADLDLGPVVAIDTETMGLQPYRDRLCLVQLSSGDGTVHLVQVNHSRKIKAPNLVRLLKNKKVVKLFHFARFDVRALYEALGVVTAPIYCTKVASKLVRTYTERHGLKELCKELLGVELSKESQSSDWGAEKLSPEQMRYAASDVLHLHALKHKLDALLAREGRIELAAQTCAYIPTQAQLDLLGYSKHELLEH